MKTPVVEIAKAENGYMVKIIRTLSQEFYVYGSIKELFEFLLFHFEGKSKEFDGDLYGEVIVKTKD